MAILPGRYGRVNYDATPSGSPAEGPPLTSINAWTGSFVTDFEDVTCFNDTNKIWIPGLRDASGTVAGFWNSVDTTMFTASSATTPGHLVLIPNIVDNTQPTGIHQPGSPGDAPLFQGLAYLDFSINCSLAAPKVSGNWKAAGAWTLENA